jgi:ParB family transcriptional regulator, chromosome partitioning protein
MAKKTSAPKTPATKRRRPRKRAAPKSKGLSPAECATPPAGALDDLAAWVTAHDGAVLASFREPLEGHPAVLAALPLDRVQPTPFQRPLSEAHAKRLADTIGKLGCYLDPIVAVPAGDGFWTPNGRHRLEAMTRLGARTITALVLPEADLQYRILALNVEKAHNLREKALEVIGMYRDLAGADGTRESQHELEFEEPALPTLGICYEHNGRFAGGAYHPILRRVDNWLDQPLPEALAVREGRAAQVERLDARVTELVEGLKAKGFRSPYLKSFVVARINPLRFMTTVPAFDEAFATLSKRAARFNVERVRQEDITTAAAPLPDEE